MKKIFSVMVALLMATAIFAQESNRDVNGKIQYGSYETNSFFSNWFVVVGGGVNVPVDAFTNTFRKEGKVEADFGGLALYGNVGKWFDPCFGARIGWQGITSGRLGGYDAETGTYLNHVDKFVWWPNEDNTAFHYVHGDFMVNASNLFAGYKERRAIDIVPYLTTGVIFDKEASSFALGGGIQFPIRITNVVKIVPQFQAVGFNDKIFGGADNVISTSATLGVQVNLGRNNWTRKSTTLATAGIALAEAEAAANALKAQNEKLNAQALDAQKAQQALTDENNALRDENQKLAKENEELAKQIVCVNNASVWFAYNSAELTDVAKALLDKVSTEKSVVVEGYASPDGSASYNKKLSQRRAQAVADYLTARGVTVESVTGFGEDITNISRTVIVK